MGAIIVLRIVHIGAGVFWAGGVMFMNVVVGPAIGGAGLEGVRVMQEMHRRHFFHKILGAALLTILSGLRPGAPGFRRLPVLVVPFAVRHGNLHRDDRGDRRVPDRIVFHQSRDEPHGGTGRRDDAGQFAGSACRDPAEN